MLKAEAAHRVRQDETTKGLGKLRKVAGAQETNDAIHQMAKASAMNRIPRTEDLHVGETWMRNH